MHHTSTETVLRCTGLRRSFGDLVAVEDVGFEVRAGETYGLLGPNGAGKTTTISMLVGLLHPDAGEVTVAGEPIGPCYTDARRHVGLVPQDLAIYPDLTARENLAFFGRLQGLAGAELRRRVDEVVEVTGLTDRADDRTDEYSGGMKRRCNIGIGLLHRPRLLVLDEPTVGVDPQSRDAILSAVEALAGEGMAVLYTTHYMEEAERLCDRVGIIDRGRLQAEGTRPELVATLGQLDTVTVDATGATDAAADALRRLDGVADVSTSDAGLVVTVADAGGRLGALLAEATAAGAQVRAVRVDEPDLEAVFLHLTGRALRD